jgi:hypothetical protein
VPDGKHLATDKPEAVPADPTPSYPPQLLPSADQPPRFGKMLWLLVVGQLIAGTVLLVSFAPRLAWPDPQVRDVVGLGFLLGQQVRVIAPALAGICLLVSGLSLMISSRRRGLRFAMAAMWLLLASSFMLSALQWLLPGAPGEAPLLLAANAVMTAVGQGGLVAAGSLAYFHTTPRLRQVFPASRSLEDPAASPVVPGPATPLRRPATIFRTWLMVLFGYLLVPVGWALWPLWTILSAWRQYDDAVALRYDLVQ